MIECQHSPQTWQELLYQIIQNPAEKQRLIRQTNIRGITLTRWIKGISTPRSANLQTLLKALPPSYSPLFEQLISADFPALATKPPERQSALPEIPLWLYRDALKAYAQTPPILWQQNLCNLLLQQMLKQFGPNCPGLTISIAHCLWHRTEKKVRSLRLEQEMSLSLWRSNLGQRMILLGAESSAGIAVMKCRPIQASRQTELNPLRWEEHEQSILCCPLMRQTRIAGCLLMASTQPDVFHEVHHALMRNYADLMALSFEADAFFDLKDIALLRMPPSSSQEPHFRHFSQRILQKIRRDCLTLQEAQEWVWQEIEEELLAVV